MTDPSRLNPAQRAHALDRLSTEMFDVVVIGGGATGSGAALDAASRGLSVALVEARDLAAGTSSRSSKLIHGGLRYLEQFNFALVREALRERSLLLNTLCPHLVKPVPFLYPLTHRGWERPYVTSGMLLYDTMAGHSGLPRHRQLTRHGALKIAPALKRESLVGALQYYDGKVDDARHTLAVARTAARYGAVVATNLPVVAFRQEAGRITGVKVHDLASDADFEIRAQQVVNASGVWTDDVQHLVGERGKFQVRASKGVHIVVPRDRLQLDTGLILRTQTSVLFVIPWGRHWIIGTTDTDWDLSKAHPAASRSDIDYILERINADLNQELTRDDVQGVYAGLRPLLSGEDEGTSQLSREHAVASPVPGLVSVAGGKYTTYRVMGKDAIDAAVHGLQRTVPASVTDRTELIGADGYRALWNARQRLADQHGLHVARVEHLLNRHGSEIHVLLARIDARRELAEPIPGADDYLMAEVVHAVEDEGARQLDDVLARRTRISIETFHRGTESAEPVAALMAQTLGWDEAETARQVDSYSRRVEAERRSQEEPDDEAADEVRASAPDLLAGLSVG